MQGRYDQVGFARLPAASQQGVLRDLWNRIHRAHGEFRAADVRGSGSLSLVLRGLVQQAGQFARGGGLLWRRRGHGSLGAAPMNALSTPELKSTLGRSAGAPFRFPVELHRGATAPRGQHMTGPAGRESPDARN
jgi:hypothetical protein